MNINMTLEEALNRIQELEKENEDLKKQLEVYKNYNFGGRKKHDAKWQASYAKWVELYETGMSMVEIVEKSDISRRTCYRYKAYYEEVNKKEEDK